MSSLSGKCRWRIVPLLLLSMICSVVVCKNNNKLIRRRTQEQEQQPIRPYDYKDIERSASLFHGYYARVLLFDGDTFTWWDIRDKEILLVNSAAGGRAVRAVPLLVHALKENFPDRFKKGQPPLQIMTEDGDSIDFGEKCTNYPQECSMNTMPPLLAHGSVPVNTGDFPFIKAYPNWFFGECLYHWKVKKQVGVPCDAWWGPNKALLSWVAQNKDVKWDDLAPTIIWRGSDHAFLGHVEEYKDANNYRGTFPMLQDFNENSSHDEVLDSLVSVYDKMTPRWRAVITTCQNDIQVIQGEKQWIDVRFYETNGNAHYHQQFNDYGVKVRSDDGMDAIEQAMYRYQIDFGGGGGTTWRGTLTKMAMPGVLFHHETKMKDWYFDLLTPWQHYVPVKWDLSDMRERYDWAQTHPEECQRISKNASDLVQYLLSEEYLETLYGELYRDYLGRVVEAYQPTRIENQYAGHSTTIQSHLRDQYDKDGYEFTLVIQCDDHDCYQGGSIDGNMQVKGEAISY